MSYDDISCLSEELKTKINKFTQNTGNFGGYMNNMQNIQGINPMINQMMPNMMNMNNMSNMNTMTNMNSINSLNFGQGNNFFMMNGQNQAEGNSGNITGINPTNIGNFPINVNGKRNGIPQTNSNQIINANGSNMANSNNGINMNNMNLNRKSSQHSNFGNENEKDEKKREGQNGKYTCRFEIQIENDKEFQVARRLIGAKVKFNIYIYIII